MSAPAGHEQSLSGQVRRLIDGAFFAGRMLYTFASPIKADKVPAGPDWLHEVKYDGMHPRNIPNLPTANSLATFNKSTLTERSSGASITRTARADTVAPTWKPQNVQCVYDRVAKTLAVDPTVDMTNTNEHQGWGVRSIICGTTTANFCMDMRRWWAGPAVGRASSTWAHSRHWALRSPRM
jgi:hypothetical protein